MWWFGREINGGGGGSGFFLFFLVCYAHGFSCTIFVPHPLPPSLPPQVRPSHQPHSSHPPRWLVFTVSLSDTLKIVNVRSSLVLHNATEVTLDVRLERPPSSLGSIEPSSDPSDSRSAGMNFHIIMHPYVMYVCTHLLYMLRCGLFCS